MVDRTCLSYWFPPIEMAGLPVPRTKIITVPNYGLDLLGLIDVNADSEAQCDVAVRNVFLQGLAMLATTVGYPAFLRTGQGSGKHQWRQTCYVERPEDLPSHVAALVEWSMMVDIMGLPYDVWAVREMLHTEPAFHAFDGMPITRERRWFVRGDEILGWQPYWPPGAFEEFAADGSSWAPDVDDWEERLVELNTPIGGELDVLRTLTKTVGRTLPETAWSVDWLWTPNRSWVLTDMAEAARSYVWEDCPTAPAQAALSG